MRKPTTSGMAIGSSRAAMDAADPILGLTAQMTPAMVNPAPSARIVLMRRRPPGPKPMPSTSNEPRVWPVTMETVNRATPSRGTVSVWEITTNAPTQPAARYQRGKRFSRRARGIAMAPARARGNTSEAMAITMSPMVKLTNEAATGSPSRSPRAPLMRLWIGIANPATTAIAT